MRILLVRHGVTAANAEGRLQGHADVELSADGADQAERLHRRFAAEGLRPTSVYSSPLLRTAETARIVSRSWDVPIVALGRPEGDGRGRVHGPHDGRGRGPVSGDDARLPAGR